MEFELPSNSILRPCIMEDLIRIGPLGDGGYCLSLENLSELDFFISIGLGRNFEFEKQILEIYKIPGIGIDPGWSLQTWIKHFLKCGTKLLFNHSSQFAISIEQFVQQFLFQVSHFKMQTVPKKCVPIKMSSNQIAFAQILKKFSCYSNKLLKIDIEGDEYSILDKDLDLSGISVIIIEFHDINHKMSEFVKIVNNILLHFHLTHLHINPNFPLGKGPMPDILELTFERHCNSSSHRSRNSLPLKNLDYLGDRGIKGSHSVRFV